MEVLKPLERCSQRPREFGHFQGSFAIGYPCVALSALAPLFCVYLGLRYGPKPAFACPSASYHK